MLLSVARSRMESAAGDQATEDHTMSDRVVHCPFLNRADPRCAGHFSLDRLGVAFDHCFGTYKTCTHYRQLLLERRTRRGELQPGEQPAELTDHAGPQPHTLDNASHGQLRPAFAAFHLPIVEAQNAAPHAALAD